MDGPRDEQFPSQEKLMRELKSRIDDVESVVLPIAKAIQITNSSGLPVRQMTSVGGQIKYISGESSIIHLEDMETMINDGVFQRMGIKIRLKPC
jgi:hypothetical protein